MLRDSYPDIIDGIYLPSIAEIEKLEQQRKQATDNLVVIDGSRVKCQNPRCKATVPLHGDIYSRRPPNYENLRKLEVRVRDLEKKQERRGPTAPQPEEEVKTIKQLKEEIASIYRENEQNVLRRCPLYFRQYKRSVRFVCSKCWERR